MLQFYALGGFLGAGKTTTMLAAARLLEAAGERVIVITNDQGADLVDSQLTRAVVGDGHGEVTGGCFCCRFEDLVAVIRDRVAATSPTVVLAEAVGSCTDLQSTVLRPLRAHYGDELRVGPLTAVVDPHRYLALSKSFADADEPDLTYLFRHQLDEAEIIAVNKADTVAGPVAGQLDADLRHRFPNARVLTYSATRGDGMGELVASWTSRTAGPGHRPFAVDYDRYATAEAELAWCNQTFSITATRAFSLSRWVRTFLRSFGEACATTGAAIGHVKVRVAAEAGTVKASLVAADAEPVKDAGPDPVTDRGEVTLNARVATEPSALGAIIDRATRVACGTSGSLAGPRLGTIFRPSYPEPTYRM